MRRVVSTLASVSLIVAGMAALASPASATPPANAEAVASGNSAFPDVPTILTANANAMVWETLNAADQPTLYAQKLDNGSLSGDPVALTGGNFTYLTQHGFQPGINLSISGSTVAAAGASFSSFGSEQQRVSLYNLATDTALNPIISGYGDGGGSLNNAVFFAGASPAGILFVNLIAANGDTPASVHVMEEDPSTDPRTITDLGVLPNASTDPTALAGVTATTSPNGSVIAYPTTLTDTQNNNAAEDSLAYVPYNGDGPSVLDTEDTGAFNNALVTGGGYAAWANYLQSFASPGCTYYTIPLDGSGNGAPTKYSPANGFCEKLAGVTDSDLVFGSFPVSGGQGTGTSAGTCPLTVQTCAYQPFATVDLLDGSVTKSSSVYALSAATDGTNLFLSKGSVLGNDPGDAGIYSATSATSAETLLLPASAKPLAADQVAISPGRVTWSDDSATSYPVSTRTFAPNGLTPTLGTPSTVAASTVAANPSGGYGVATSGGRTVYAVPAATSGGKDSLIVQEPDGSMQTVTTFTDGTPYLNNYQYPPIPGTVQVSGSNVLYLTNNPDTTTGGYIAHLYSTVTHATRTVGSAGAAFALSGGYLAWVGTDGSVMRQDIVTNATAVQLRAPTALETGQTVSINAEVAAAGDYVGWLVQECVQVDFGPCTGNTEAGYRNAATLDPATIVLTAPTTPDSGSYPATPQHIAMSDDYMLVDEVNSYFGQVGSRTLVAAKLADGTTANVTSADQYVSGAGKFAIDGSTATWIDPSGAPEIMALDTNSDAPRVLTVDAPSTVATSSAADFEVVASAALSDCTVEIKSGDTSVRTLDCSTGAADGDGIVSWDGKDADGNPVAPGSYSWTITGSNGAGALTDYDGSDSPITGTMNVVSGTHTSATWPSGITYGTAFSVKATVTGDTGTPTGTVTLKSGSSTLATGTLSSGTATLHVGGTKLTPGSHSLTLSYDGSDTFGSSSTSKTFTVAKAAARMSVSWPSSGTYGRSLSVAVRVSATGTTPTGTVRLKWGSTTLASHSLYGGKATLTVHTLRLKPGVHHTLSVSYAGSSTVSSASTSDKLWVNRATAHMSEYLHPKTVQRTAHARLRVHVWATGTTPTGTIRVYQGSTRIVTVKLTAAKHGVIVITLPKIRSLGKHKIHARYFGSTYVKSVTGSRITLRVVA